MDQVILFIKDKQSVVYETEQCPELDPDNHAIRGNDGGVSTFSQDILQSGRLVSKVFFYPKSFLSKTCSVAAF